MRRFQFRLQAVLNHRKTLEEQREREFGEAQFRLQRAEMRYKELEQEYLSLASVRHSNNQRLDIQGTIAREHYIASLKFRMEKVEREIDAAKIVAEEAKELLVKARQDREAVSKIQEKALYEYQRENLRLDQEAFDEMATVRYVRQNAQGR